MGEKPRIARSRATSAPSSTVPSTSPFAATRIACAGRCGGVASHARHTRAFPSQRARAHVHERHTKHQARRRASALAAQEMLRSGEERERDRGRVRVRARAGGTSGGERVPRTARRRRRCSGKRFACCPRTLVGRRRSTAIHRALRLRIGGCTSVPTTSRARGDAPAPSVEECAFELDADAAQLVVDGA
ncbi:hypothetical protein DFH09DRAFT_282583 [Mycena vulgaris]|nr:hypothetical protein DFH09DRAFT_282583 [Mycena vulgaris]